MSLENQKTPILDEKIWNAWIEKGRQSDRKSARRMRIFAQLAASVAAIGYATFLLTR